MILGLVGFAAPLVAIASASDAASNPALHAYGPAVVQPATSYFRHWAGAVSDMPGADAMAAEKARGPPVAEEIGDMLRRSSSDCGPGVPAPAEGTLRLLASSVDAAGVRHSLAATATSQLRYVASAGGRALAVEPSPCEGASPGIAELAARRLNFAMLSTARHTMLREPPMQSAEPSKLVVDAPASLLAPDSDPLVRDCLALYARTALERCGRRDRAEARSASLQVADGLLLHLRVATRDDVVHRVACAFEVPNGTVAKSGQEEALPEEEDGMSATLLMHHDICARHAQGASAEDVQVRKLLKVRRMGELSVYKGFQRVYDRLPKWVAGIQSKAGLLPDTLLFPEKYPMCFPRAHTVVRSQGACGSCWAFAAASALMTNICVAGSGNSSLDEHGVRHEVAVQRILSCNSDRLGCEGGHSVAADSAFRGHGIAEERYQPYMCGGGSSLDHFRLASESCSASPWGAVDAGAFCAEGHAVEAWRYSGLYAVQGEMGMRQALFEGHSLYVAALVYTNFLLFEGGRVFDRIEGDEEGGHAMLCLGFAQRFEAGLPKPFWLLQNSWGPAWGDKGFAKFLRGANLANIEAYKATIFVGMPVGEWRATGASSIAAPAAAKSGGDMLQRLQAVLDMVVYNWVGLLAPVAGVMILWAICHFGKSSKKGSEKRTRFEPVSQGA